MGEALGVLLGIVIIGGFLYMIYAKVTNAAVVLKSNREARRYAQGVHEREKQERSKPPRP
jgi:hypothetical protein